MAYDRVESQFDSASAYAASATARADTFISALSSVMGELAAPPVDIDMEWPDAPSLAPNLALNVVTPGFSFPADDTGLPPSAPSIALAIGDAPTAPAYQQFVYAPGVLPSAPAAPGEMAVVALPSGLSDWVPPAPPAMLNFNIRAFGGVNTYDEWAASLSIPGDLFLDAPSPFVGPDLQRYGSALLDSLSANIRARLDGGTGLDPAIEALIWDRGRDREAATAAVNIAEVIRNAEARGFSLPTGAMHAQLREAQRMLHAKTSEISRDVMVKQAELAQANAKHAIEQGIALEGQLIDYANAMEQRVFDAAKYVAQNAVDIYNSLVAQYRANLEKYTAAVGAYRGLIEGEQAKVAVYRTEIDAERAKVEVNQAAIAQYRAQIEVRNTEIEQYKNELVAVQTLIGVDKLKIEAYGERVKAYATEVNTETVRAEVFKAQNQGNQALADVFRASVDAYAAELRARSEAAKTTADIYDAQVRGYASRVQGYVGRVTAETEKVRAKTDIAGLQVEIGKAQIGQNVSSNQLQIENYRAQIGLYEANKSIAFQRAKVLSDNYFTLRSMVADASKVAAQVNAQLAASAYGTIRASASVSGADSTNTQFNYSGRTSDTRAAPNYA